MLVSAKVHSSLVRGQDNVCGLLYHLEVVPFPRFFAWFSLGGGCNLLNAAAAGHPAVACSSSGLALSSCSGFREHALRNIIFMIHCVLLQGLEWLLQTNCISSRSAAATPAVAAAIALSIV